MVVTVDYGYLVMVFGQGVYLMTVERREFVFPGRGGTDGWILNGDLADFRFALGRGVVLACEVCIAVPELAVFDRKPVDVGITGVQCNSFFFCSRFNVILHNYVVGRVRAPQPITHAGQTVQAGELHFELVNDFVPPRTDRQEISRAG